jgi:dUTP diphosphatase
MEALKEFDIEELLKRQAMLDKKFDEKETIRKRELRLIRLAYHTELGEFLQEVKSEWNYWKNSCEVVNKQKALEELSDMLHFSLSYVNNDRFDSRIRNKDIKLKKEFFKKEKYDFTILLDFLTALYNHDEHFSTILLIAEYLGATEEEFLQVHHEKWLKNMNERTKGEY